MVNPETQNEVIGERVRETSAVEENLKKTNETVSRSAALVRLAELESRTPEQLLERMKEVTVAQREAKNSDKPFMENYTKEVRAHAVELALDPSEYAGLRTKLDLSLESLA